MEELLTSYLLGTASVAALVETRINWNVRPQLDAMPSICMTKVSAERTYHMQAQTNLIAARVQLDCWAVTFWYGDSCC